VAMNPYTKPCHGADHDGMIWPVGAGTGHLVAILRFVHHTQMKDADARPAK